MIALNKTIRLFLDGIGRREEYEFYLDKFQADRSACFALLCPDAGSIETGTEVLAFDLHFLLRLELVPAILLCGREAAAMRALLEAEPIFTFQEIDAGPVVSFIEDARRREKVPVLVAGTMELEEALVQWVPEVARRVHYIRAAGGLKNCDGELIPYFYTHKENRQVPEALEIDLPALGKRLLEERPGVHFSVTSPINLLQEIFTVKGAGTLFRKGSTIQHARGSEGIDRARLIDLLEASFGKTLSDTEFLDDTEHCYTEKDYRGAVLLEKHPSGMYLSKFAVGREARGEGVALELWREVCLHHDALFWRSKTANPFNLWYRKQADGHHVSGPWQIFWRGVDADDISGSSGFA